MFCQARMRIKMSPLSVHCQINSNQVVNNNALRAFHCQCHVLYRYKTTSLRSKMP